MRGDHQENLLDDSDSSEEEVDEVDSDVDEIDFDNFKGIYFGDDPNKKYTCPETGAHFEIKDISKRLIKAREERN